MIFTKDHIIQGSNTITVKINKFDIILFNLLFSFSNLLFSFSNLLF